MRLFRSLRSKLVAVFLAPTLLIILLYGALAHFASREGLEEELGKRLVSIGQTLSADMSDDFDAKQIARLDAEKHRVIERLREKLEAVRDRTTVRRVFIFDRELRSLVDTQNDTDFGEQLYALEADRLELQRVFDEGVSATSVLFTGPDGRRYKTAYVPILLGEDVVAAIGVEASAGYFDLLTDFTTVLTVLGAVGILLVIVVGAVFARRLTRPVNRLVAVARRMGRGELDQPVVDLEARGPEGDEIAFLGRAFEEMRRDLVSRDQQMQMMLSGIAHEVRNPLGGMELFCGLLEEDLRDEEDTSSREEKLEKVAKIKRELTYLEQVVRDFLDFARAVPIEVERFEGGAFLEEIENLMGGEAAGVGCNLRVDVDPPAVELTGDRQKLRRAVINVVRNAYQACGEDGVVRLEIHAPSEEQRLIRIVDNGPGIPRDKIVAILQPFYTTKEKGSGLGLSLTVQIVEQHGGEMTISSPEEGGTVVEFLLPFDASLETTSAEIPEGWLG